MADRQGIEIDYCPQCRGVWLDRGELDKLIERSAAEMAPSQPDYSRGQPRTQPAGKYKKKSLLKELLDF
jgi:Zn-finger nucleic acid-binding protein